jgi:small subunit ribosomal protein S16
MLKKHLAGGVKKGAFTAEQAEEKFNAWLEGKNKEVEAKRSKLNDAEAKVKADALAAEKAVNEQRIADASPIEELEEETAEASSTDQEEETTEEVVEASATEEAVEETAKEEE